MQQFPEIAFKALRKVPNKSLPHTFDDYRIAAALINRFLAKHLDNGSYVFCVNKQENLFDDCKILMINIQSRNLNATKYRSYVKYKPNVNRLKAGIARARMVHELLVVVIM